MSGVVAVVNTDGAPIDAAFLGDLTSAMAFRGPDARATWARDNVGLGHTLARATVESAREAQPCSVGDDVWIAADARLDGRAALVRGLRERGRGAASADAPDAELILHAYLAWGDACLDHLIGDFSFVLWDGRRRRMLAARDQLGVAQLFHARAGTTLLVGNTIQALLGHPGVSDALDERTVADVALFTLYLDDSATAYAAIRRVAPGHRLTWDSHGLRIERYWTLREPARAIRYSHPAEYAERFRFLFDQAVEDRLRTDRVGTQLSGGMDSTSIAVTARQLLGATGRPFQLRGYSIEYRSLLPDQEADLATAVGRRAGFPVEVLSGEAYMRREPAGAPARVPPEPGVATLWVMDEICRRAAAFAPVLLTGYGGDPLLEPPRLTRRRTAAALRQGAWRWPLQRVAAQRRRARQLRRPPDAPPAWVADRWAREVDLAERATLYRQGTRRDQAGVAEAPLWRTLFAWSDAGYNGLPLSVRFPFFDLRLLEFVLAIPPVPWLDRKHVLRAAMGDRLPDVVRERPKTVMAGDVVQRQNARAGVPEWELDLLGRPELEPYVDQDWLRAVQRETAAARAHIWATQRPPVQLAYWLRHRPTWDWRPAGPRSDLANGQDATYARAT